MNRQNPKEMAIHISTERKLKYDEVMEGKEIVSVRFYYLFEKVKYYLWVDVEKKDGSWKFRWEKYFTFLEDQICLYLQQERKTTEQVAYLVDCIMEKYRTE